MMIVPSSLGTTCVYRTGILQTAIVQTHIIRLIYNPRPGHRDVGFPDQFLDLHDVWPDKNQTSNWDGYKKNNKKCDISMNWSDNKRFQGMDVRRLPVR